MSASIKIWWKTSKANGLIEAVIRQRADTDRQVEEERASIWTEQAQDDGDDETASTERASSRPTDDVTSGHVNARRRRHDAMTYAQ